MPKTIVIIGGAHGGPTAAARARLANEDARIVLVEKGAHVTWVQADLRHYLEGDTTRLEQSLSERNAYFCKRFNVEVRTNSEVIAIDMDACAVALSKGNEFERIGFDAVVFAGGAVSKEIELDGLEEEYTAHFRNLNDMRKIKAAIANGATSAVVLGCGAYGVEAALGLKNAGLDVTVVEKNPRILGRFSLPTAHALSQQLFSFGIKVLTGETPVSVVKRHKKGFVLKLHSGAEIPADLAVVTVGSHPHTKLLSQAGAALNRDGSVRVDAFMATTLPRVYACGSAVSVPEFITNERIWLPQPSIVERTAQIAGANAAMENPASRESFKPVTGTHLIQVGGFWFARTGLTQSEARKHFGDENVFITTIHSRSGEVWHDADELSVSLLCESVNGTIIGGEVFGKHGISRRIDMISAAATERWSPAKLVDLDMAYAASLGPAFDPLKEAGMRANLVLKKQSKAISGEKLALWMAEQKSFTWIDVSQKESEPRKKAQNLGNVRSFPLEELRDHLDEIDKAKPIVLSSRSGSRAFLAHQLLSQRGFESVYHLDGGHITWDLMMGAPE